MKFDTSDIIAAGAIAVAVIGFAWGTRMNNNYKNEKRARNDDKILKEVQSFWADFRKDAEGNGAATVHAEVDKFINRHEWFSEALKEAAKEMNSHYLNINL